MFQREPGRSREWGVRVALAGMSVSLVARAELVHAHCAGLRLDLSQAPRARAATLTITDMQWDNQVCCPLTTPLLDKQVITLSFGFYLRS